jgi:3-oxoacyl-[acyl-carrier protein] reductase
MSDILKDKVALITGSGQGIGRAIAIAMAREGAKVVTNNRRPGTEGGDAETTAKEIIAMGGQSVPFFGSVSDFAVAKKLIQTALNNFGRLDILVNNAGFVAYKALWDMTEEDWDYTMAVHLKGTFNCIRHACVIMKEQKWGRILNTTSPARLGMIDHCDYGAVKAGILGLTKSVAMDLGIYGITCNAYGPGAATRMTFGEEQKARFRRMYDSGAITKASYESLMNLPSPEMITPFVIYLCTDEAADINGQVFHVRGREIQIYVEEVKNSLVKEQGSWTIEELVELVPNVLLQQVKSNINASPPS